MSLISKYKWLILLFITGFAISSFYYLKFSAETARNSDLVDERDGKLYKTQKIGTQTWMAANLNFETSASYCYDKSPENCQTFGRFYNYVEAMTACPKGWHLPSDEEWKTVESHLGMEQDQVDAFRMWRGKEAGNQLKKLFSAVFPGVAYPNGRKFQGKELVARYWSASQGPTNESFAIYRQLMTTENGIYSDQIAKMNLCCIRCLKD